VQRASNDACRIVSGMVSYPLPFSWLARSQFCAAEVDAARTC